MIQYPVRKFISNYENVYSDSSKFIQYPVRKFIRYYRWWGGKVENIQYPVRKFIR